MRNDRRMRAEERRIISGLIDKLREGVAPWIQPWSAVATLPVNRLTGKAYRGSNVLGLWMAQILGGFGSREWLTRKQAARLGGTILPGERPAGLVRYFQPVTWTEEDEAGTKRQRRSCVVRAFDVFNLDQVSGVEPRPVRGRSVLDVVQDVESFIADIGADVRVGDRPCYWVAEDIIVMPRPQAFSGFGEYASVSLHEHAHWTGPRLGRDLTSGRDTAEYALEELIAELTAAFLAAEFGLRGRLQHAEYIGAWIRVLEEEPTVLFRVAHQASRAADFLRRTASQNGRRYRLDG